MDKKNLLSGHFGLPRNKCTYVSCLSFFAVLLFIMPEFRYGPVVLAGEILVSALAAQRFLRPMGTQFRWEWKKPALLCWQVLVTMCLFDSFCGRWKDSSIVNSLAGMLGMKTPLLLSAAACILAAVSQPGLNVCISVLWQLYRKAVRQLEHSIPNISEYCAVLLFSVLGHLQLNYSSLGSFYGAWTKNIAAFLCSISLILFLNTLLQMLFGRRRQAMLVSAIAVSLWSIVNHYVVLFHESPMFFHELLNARTGMAVAGGYQFRIDLVVIGLAVIFGCQYCCICAIGKSNAGRRSFFDGACLILGMVVVGGLLLVIRFAAFSPIGWSWYSGIADNGYSICMLEDIYRYYRPYQMPTDYESVKRELLAEEPGETGQAVAVNGEKPDIILILNESFYDIGNYVDFENGENPLTDFYGIDGAVYGSCLVPEMVSTNVSEFELLTSGSRKLISGISPFSYVDFANHPMGIAYYLKRLGYSATAMHCEMPENYNRVRAYPAMGFDNVILGPTMFQYHGSNGKRPWLDSDNYRDLVDRYEQDGDGPRFYYLLTFQNHGGYQQNDDSLDTVHVLDSFGAEQDQLNEFASSVRLSAQAFRELTEIFSEVRRPVVICMVGDHSPTAASALEISQSRNPVERAGIGRVTPWVMWSNYGLEFEGISGSMMMTDLLPCLLEAAGLPMSPYYRMVSELHKTVPIRNSSGLYLDKDNTIGVLEKGNRYFDAVNRYYCMEYFYLQDMDESTEWLFFPQ